MITIYCIYLKVHIITTAYLKCTKTAFDFKNGEKKRTDIDSLFLVGISNKHVPKQT